jgi:hypothetical protein
LEEIIKQKLIIDIDTAPNWDKVYSGICLALNQEIILLLNYNDDTFEFDGFSILKVKDFEKYRVWEKEDYKELKNDNSKEQIKDLNLEMFTDLKTSLTNLKPELIAIYTYDDENSYFVGKIENFEGEMIDLKLISENSEWLDNRKIDLNEISYIGFRTSYEKELIKNVV